MPQNKDAYRKYAADYDQKSEESRWYGPAVLFGLMYNQVQSGQSLLDVGIGTGLGSERFHGAGLAISGMDSSPAMLEQCRQKGLASNLTRHNLAEFPWPFKDECFHHVISTGVFHFFGDLAGVFAETARIIKPGGVFGFDISEHDLHNTGGYEKTGDGIYSRVDGEYGDRVFRHSERYIFDLLAQTGFAVVDDVDFLVYRERKGYFRAITARRGQ